MLRLPIGDLLPSFDDQEPQILEQGVVKGEVYFFMLGV
jgi:hypothetical protein